MARPGGFEPPTPGFEAQCSVQLSYERAARRAGIVQKSDRRFKAEKHRSNDVTALQQKPQAWHFEPMLCLLLVVFTVHNAEESVRGLSGWVAAQSFSWRQVDQNTIDIALLTITVTSWLGFVWVCLNRNEWTRWFVTLCAACAMLVNSVLHLALSLRTGSWMPGAITALLLVGPVCTVFVIRQITSRSTSTRHVAYAAAVGLVSNAIIPSLTIVMVQLPQELLSNPM